MFKRALVSVSDKSNLVGFLAPLVEKGLRLVSTGGTANFLREQGWQVQDVSDVTGFPEVLQGRVKTLHPKIHMGLLAKLNETAHVETLEHFQVEPFDLVIGNLYPFEQALQNKSSEDELIENIDIGGPSFLRSSAKNFETVTVICDPTDYQWIQKQNYSLNREERKKLAAKVFRLISVYDQMISQTLDPDLISLWSAGGRLHQKLRYGENSHQQAWWIAQTGVSAGLHQAEILQGKELSYNNILDLDAAFLLVQKFSQPAAIAVKHNNPCGAALDADSFRALEKALSADPVSVFGGIVALNFPVKAVHANLMKDLFLECILAPDFDEASRQILSSKKNLRLLKGQWPSVGVRNEIRTVFGGVLVQNPDVRWSDPKDWKIFGAVPDAGLRETMLFGEKVCASLKSNAIAIVGDGQTLGLGMGQVNRVDAVEQALRRWKQHHADKKEAVLVSDAFFPFPDSIEKAAEQGIRWVVQPGGSMRDEDVISKAQQLGVNLVITGLRHFKH
ncbi:MAG: bifunctional phosphoribosylaminoimidazolecarboxamide formyltransferase/IMP cyclohydrolase [Bdellovibrionales bacterium]